MPESPSHDPLPPNVRRFAPWRWHWSYQVAVALYLLFALMVAWLAVLIRGVPHL